ncbi:MAG: hypothetical protein EBR30_01020 [Cytophagia bacterium]|jgi:hypothetical protein|nr:hypothetical protein [Cytophagia bacterium]NBW33616.1 hypothetical protein [Cytophagia bacterium]
MRDNVSRLLEEKYQTVVEQNIKDEAVATPGPLVPGTTPVSTSPAANTATIVKDGRGHYVKIDDLWYRVNAYPVGPDVADRLNKSAATPGTAPAPAPTPTRTLPQRGPGGRFLPKTPAPAPAPSFFDRLKNRVRLGRPGASAYPEREEWKIRQMRSPSSLKVPGAGFRSAYESKKPTIDKKA